MIFMHLQSNRKTRRIKQKESPDKTQFPPLSSTGKKDETIHSEGATPGKFVACRVQCLDLQIAQQG